MLQDAAVMQAFPIPAGNFTVNQGFINGASPQGSNFRVAEPEDIPVTPVNWGNPAGEVIPDASLVDTNPLTYGEQIAGVAQFYKEAGTGLVEGIGNSFTVMGSSFLKAAWQSAEIESDIDTGNDRSYSEIQATTANWWDGKTFTPSTRVEQGLEPVGEGVAPFLIDPALEGASLAIDNLGPVTLRVLADTSGTVPIDVATFGLSKLLGGTEALDPLASSDATIEGLTAPNTGAEGAPAALQSNGLSTVQLNNQVGNSFDDYVVATKLSALDDAGQLIRQQQLPTPDVEGLNYVKPDYTLYTANDTVGAYADAKTGAYIPFDAQAEGLVNWSTTTTSRTLIYYTPDGTAVIDPELIRYAQSQGVMVRQIGVK